MCICTNNNNLENYQMKASDLNFTVELKSTYASRQPFPSNDVVGIAMARPDQKKPIYRMKISLPEAACKKAQIKPFGYLMAKISDCSNGLQILYEDQQGANFKGYAVRPLGAYKTVDKIKEAQKANKSPYLAMFAELTIPFDLLDTNRTQKFTNKFVKILSIGKHNIVVDISNNVPIFVAKGAAK